MPTEPAETSAARVLLALVLLWMPTAAGGADDAAAPAPARNPATAAYVVSQSNSRIDILAADPPRHVGAVTLGEQARHIAASPDGRYVAAVGRDALGILDTSTMAAPRRLPGSDGYDVPAFAPTGGTLWAGRTRGGRNPFEPRGAPAGPPTISVEVVGDAPQWQALGDVPAASQVTAIAFTPDGKTGFVADRLGLNVVDVATRKVRATARTKRPVTALQVSPDGRRVYALNPTIDTVYVVDVAAGRVDGEIELRPTPYDIALSADGTRLYAALGDASFDPTTDGGVAVVDCATLERVATVPTGGRPFSVAVGPGGDRLFVGDSQAKHLTVIDLRDNAVAARVDMPAAPLRVYAWPGRGEMLALCPGAEQAVLVDAKAATVIGALPISSGALYAAFAGVGDPKGEAFTVAAPPAPKPRPNLGAARPAPAGNPNPPPVAVAPAKLPGYDKDRRGPLWNNLPAVVALVEDPTDAQLQRVAPRLITVDFKNAPPRDVAAEVGRQAGYKLVPQNPAFWSGFREPVSVRASAVPIWAVLEDLTARSLVEVRSDRPGIFELTGPARVDPAARPPLVSGAFRLHVRGPARRTSVEPIGGKPHARYELSVWLEPEPGLHVAGTARDVTLVDAVDEHGQAFVGRPRADVMQLGSTLTLDLHLFRPTGAAGATVRTLAGVGHLLAAVDVGRVRVEDLPAHRQATEHDVGGIRVRIHGVEREGLADPQTQRHAVRVTVKRDGRDEREWWRLRQLLAVSRLRLLNGAGNELRPEPNVEQTPDTFTRVLRVRVDPGNDAWSSGDPAALVVEVPTKVVEVDVPFVFNDVPLEPAPR